MPNTYVDRGIIKWSAFDALDGYRSMLKEMQHRLNKKSKPILSEDDFEDLNRDLKQAIFSQFEIELIYFDSGYYKTTYGKIKKLDYINKIIILTTLEKISAFDVIRINIL